MVYVYLSIITIEYLFYFQTMFGRYCFECAPRDFAPVHLMFLCPAFNGVPVFGFVELFGFYVQLVLNFFFFLYRVG